MNSLDENHRMPMLGSSEIDYEALELIHRWMLTLDTPEEFQFNFDQRQTPAQNDPHAVAGAQAMPTDSGLHVQLEFETTGAVPPVMLIYWPEDSSL